MTGGAGTVSWSSSSRATLGRLPPLKALTKATLEELPVETGAWS